MKKNKRILMSGKPYPLGASIDELNNINFAAVLQAKKVCGILLYDKKTSREEKIPFSEENRIGNIYCGLLLGVDPELYSYNFYADDTVIVDPYAKKIIGNEIWGKLSSSHRKNQLQSGFYRADYEWGNDRTPNIPFEESVIYCMHVRGFTQHKSSKVQSRGTFDGIREKISYLKEMGITAIELLPAYEFEEVETQKKNSSIEYMLQHYKDVCDQSGEDASSENKKINYWGFKGGYYYAPKASYGGEGFRDLVKALHSNQMELLMQFFFPANIKCGYILEVLKYWVLEYHIDGIHLLGDNIPLTLLATEPLLANTKLMYVDFPDREIYMDNEVPIYRNLASYRDDFMYDMRKFLKSDEDMLSKFLYHMKDNPSRKAVIHYITNYYGFTLSDLVSYDQKHNEINGEENKDGNDYNYSWNCGAEGKTRKKSILSLRLQQLKNALIFVILSQGTPLLNSGDEFGNSQSGNNNPYCHDNTVSWLNWNDLIKNDEIYQFIRLLLNLRRDHPILRSPEEFKMMDTISCGYPDLSYHGEEVWRPVLNNYNRNIGIMYCGKYARGTQEAGAGVRKDSEDDSFYFAYNMHWIEHGFALPKLPENMEWELIIDTSSSAIPDKNMKAVTMAAPRSVKIFKSKTVKKPKNGIRKK